MSSAVIRSLAVEDLTFEIVISFLHTQRLVNGCPVLFC